MSKEIDFSGVNAPKKDPKSKPYIKTGVTVLQVTGVSQGVSEVKKTPYIEMDFVNNEDVPFNERFYLSPKALVKLKEMLMACGVSEADANRTDVTAKEIGEWLIGKKVRVIIKGREYLNKNGKVSVGKELPFRFYCESANIPESESRLKFDPKWHYDKLDSTVADKAEDDDLPF